MRVEPRAGAESPQHAAAPAGLKPRAGVAAPPLPSGPDLALVTTPAMPALPTGAPMLPRTPRIAPTGAVIVPQVPARDEPQALAFDPTGKVIASYDLHGTLTVWEIATHAIRGRVGSLGVDGDLELSYAPDGAHLTVAGSTSIVVVDLARGAISDRFDCPHRGEGHDIVGWTPDGHALLAACEDAIRVRDVGAGAGAPRFEVTRTQDWPISGAGLLSPDGARFVASRREALEIRAIGDGHRLATAAPADLPFDIAWRPDGKAIAVAGETAVRVLDASTLRELASTPAKDAMAVAFAPAGDRALVLDSSDDRAFAWEMSTARRVQVDSYGGSVARWFPSGLLVVQNKNARTFRDGELLARIGCLGGCGDIAAVWSRDGAHAADREDAQIVIYDPTTGAAVEKLGVAPPPGDLSFDPDANTVTLEDRREKVDLSTGRTTKTVSRDDDRDARSGDGAWRWTMEVAATGRTTLLVWSATGAKHVRRIELPVGAGNPEVVRGGSLLVVGGDHPTLVDVATGRLRPVPPPPPDSTPSRYGHGSSPAVSEDGHRFAIDRTVYDTATLAIVETVASPIHSLSPHGRYALVQHLLDGWDLHRVGDPAAPVPFVRNINDRPQWSDDESLALVGDVQWDVAALEPVAQLDAPAGIAGNRCVVRDDAGVHVVRLATGETLDVYALAPGAGGVAVLRSDGAFEAGPGALAALRSRPGPSLVSGALTAVEATPTSTGAYAMIAQFLAGCR